MGRSNEDWDVEIISLLAETFATLNFAIFALTKGKS